VVDPLVAIQNSAVNAGTNALGGIINMAVTKTVDFLFGDSPEDRKKRVEEYYSRVKDIVDQHDLPIRTRGEIPYATPQQRVMQELDEVDDSIVDALRKMENARNKSRCGVCRSDIAETIKIMKERVAPIFDAQDKIRAIQQLKTEGSLPPDALWETLSPDERKRVEKIAVSIAKPRDTSQPPSSQTPFIEVQRLNAPTPFIGGIIDGDEEPEPKRRIHAKRGKPKSPRKPRAPPRKSTRKPHNPRK